MCCGLNNPLLVLKTLQEKLEGAILLEPLIQSTSFVRILLPVEFDEIVKIYEQAKDVIPRT